MANPFIEEVSRYFQEFLETDFKKRRLPKRSIQTVDRLGNLVGLRFDKYPSFKKEILKKISSAKAFEVEIKVPPKKYTRQIKSETSNLVLRQLKKIHDEGLKELVDQAEIKLMALFAIHEKSAELFIDESKFALISLIKEHLIDPSTSFLESSKEDEIAQDFVDMYPLSESIYEEKRGDFYDLLSTLVIEKNFDPVKDFLTSTLTINSLEEMVKRFFETLNINDLHSELVQLERNKKIRENLELYFYFGELKYQNHRFPLTFVQVDLDREEGVHANFILKFEKRFVINKQAIQWVYQNSIEKNVATFASIIKDRIQYVEEDQSLSESISDLINRIAEQFSIQEDFDVGRQDIIRGNNTAAELSISNSSWLSLFDKSDESAINDYEELNSLFAEGGSLAQRFIDVIDSFMEENPVPITKEIDQDWQEKSTSERLVFQCPIPVNEEQRKILRAIKSKDGRFITVQGPPGTGKSHTITAILFEAILNKESVLMLSDKKEALDVVEKKLTDTLNKVRLSEDFQNPILRLGSSGNTYSKLLNVNTVDSIKTHLLTTSDQLSREEPIKEKEAKLKKEIEDIVDLNGSIDMEGIKNYFELKEELQISDEEEENLLRDKEHIENFCKKTEFLKDRLKEISKESRDLLTPFVGKNSKQMLPGVICLEKASALVKDNNYKKSLSILKSLKFSIFPKLEKWVEEYNRKTKGFIGSLIGHWRLRDWNDGINLKLKPYLKKPIDFRNQEGFDYLNNFKKIIESIQRTKEAKDFLKSKHINFILEVIINNQDQLKKEFFYNLKNSIKDYEEVISSELNLDSLDLKSSKDYLNFDYQDALIEAKKKLDFVQKSNALHEKFNSIPDLNYSSKISGLQRDCTVRMTQNIDEQFVDFAEGHRAEAKVLKTIINKKQKFPKEGFENLKTAFPCIISGIRDYAEYIPLKEEIFDLIIIDEASQVSIAQAFPALLRGKKVVIMGDNKQFSNVKSSQASKEQNRSRLQDISKSFSLAYGNDPNDPKRVRSQVFDVTVSILDFFQYVTNYDCLLKKHFRGYPELISFSSKYFYDGKLQTVKVRNKLIDDVLEIRQIEHDGKLEVEGNINALEAEEIVRELESLCEQKEAPEVGIITPFRDQQKFILGQIDRSEKRELIYKTLKAKVMTFDSCQGEERDNIYYSMVATKEKDKLSSVLGMKFEDHMDPEENLRLQRLNVGMSRAKEKITFITSKPVNEYTGNAHKILSHYENEIKHAKSAPDPSSTESPMEKKLLKWIQDTSFHQKNKDSIMLDTQFSVGEYLKSIDPTYNHPNYRTDFLMLYKDKEGKDNNLIIEYDGFEEHFGHFKDRDQVNEFNYAYYYSDKDIEREKILENYGYPFLRFNKFNLGKDPIETINNKLESFFLI